MYSSEDLQLLASKGITEKQIEEQLCCFKKGFPFLKIDASASIGNGILSVSPQEAGT